MSNYVISKYHYVNSDKDILALLESGDDYIMLRKYNGRQGLWDGGLTKGMYIKDIPFVNPKDVKKNPTQRSTGLWSIGRSGFPIVVEAPLSWTKYMPEGIPLCGELWTEDDDNFHVGSITAKKNINYMERLDWCDVKFVPFNIKPYSLWFNPTFFEQGLDVINGIDLHLTQVAMNSPFFKNDMTYRAKLSCMPQIVMKSKVMQFPFNTRLKELNDWTVFKDHAEKNDWEGIVIAKLDCLYTVGVTRDILKWVRNFKTEATIIGYASGTEGKKYEGMIGALVVSTIWGENNSSMRGGEYTNPGQKVVYEVSSGLTDEDREGSDRIAKGSVITVKFNQITQYGKPHTGRIDWPILAIAPQV